MMCFLCFYWSFRENIPVVFLLAMKNLLLIILSRLLLLSYDRRYSFTGLLIHDLLSQLIKFNKQILNKKQGNSFRIMGGFVWLTKSFLSA